MFLLPIFNVSFLTFLAPVSIVNWRLIKFRWRWRWWWWQLYLTPL